MMFLSRCRRLVAAIGLGALLALAGAPAGAAVPATSSKAEIQKVEDYLNAVTTLKARFMQVSPDGTSGEGTVYLWRPGLLRLEYDPPNPVLVIADGTFLIYYDKQLKQVSYLDLDSTPAGILVRPHLQLEGGDLKVLKVGHQPGLLTVTVTKKDDPAQGRITLVFTEAPFQLRQWQVVDAQGQVTTVSLFDARTGVTLSKSLFEFTNPKFTGEAPPTPGGRR